MENTSATTTAQQVIAEQNTSTPLTEGLQKKFTLKVMRVQLFEDSDIVNVKLSFDKAIPGFIRDGNGDYIESEVDHVSLSRSALTKALCENDEMVAAVRDGQSTPLSRAQLSTIFHGANILISRTFHRAGYTREDGSAIDRDQWFTSIEGIVLSKFAQNLIQRLIMQRFMSE